MRVNEMRVDWREWVRGKTGRGFCKHDGRLRRVFYDEQFFGGEEARRHPAWMGKLGNVCLNISIGAAVVVTVAYFIPTLFFKYIPWLNQSKVLGEMVLASEGEEEIREENEVSEAGEILLSLQLQQNFGRKIQPVYDLSMKEGRWLRAKRVGIEAEIFTNQDKSNKQEIDQLMAKGLYIYPDYSEIGRLGRTVILAGHHYNMWMGLKESEQSFQNLDKVLVGDKIELIDDYKIWTYEVYKVEQAAEISELDADLIAYTCVYWWDSKLRLFVYGRLVDG